ncbi:sulfite exporter TauE/SafE family protein [Undibacterium sp.]|uniref:sulfite exporter TauE/SafE family protein n=1 Tax=Undibacterium sp. TaxID=1914977 RepID=UPI002CF41FCB|nr:sulfite exporter TauE/SafE family protein [Undibacterium sp.]HTD05914.1 sulfite exporter TauE/SafE family protein [Undibacterium sp.]
MENILTLVSLDTGPHFLATCLIFLLAGAVKGAIGLGLPTVAVGMLSLLMSPMEAAALLIVPSFFTNIWQLLAGPDFSGLLRRFWTMLLGVCVGTFAGAALFAQVHAGWAAAGLGLALMAYALMGLASVHWQLAGGAERWLAPVIGAVTGMLTSFTGVFVIPAVPFLQALGLNKDELVQAMGLAFTVSTIALAASLAYAGALHAESAGASFFALLPSMTGMLLGQWLRRRMNAVLFRRCFFAGLLALGGHFVWHFFA